MFTAREVARSGFIALVVAFAIAVATRLNTTGTNSTEVDVASLPRSSRVLSNTFNFRRLSSFLPSHRVISSDSKAATGQSTPLQQINAMATGRKRTPVYFVSHGGPSTMYDTQHPVYSKLQALGKEITTQVKPSAILVFSAHWQASKADMIEVNNSETEPLLYDFYGFPKHYYAEKFPNRGSPELAARVIDLLKGSGIRAEGTDRGLDHGVFVPFKVMFDPKTNPVNVPIVQVSLFDDDTDAAAHIKLGRAVEKLRDENILIIVSGMAVHNLRHFQLVAGSGQTLPYAVTFDEALKAAVETAPGSGRDVEMEGLLKRPDARQAHPTFEHLLPIHIGVGAAGNDSGKQIWTMPEGSMSWAQYRFGSVEA